MGRDGENRRTICAKPKRDDGKEKLGEADGEHVVERHLCTFKVPLGDADP